MYFNIGKVIKYEDNQGLIVTSEGDKYLFLEKDINTKVNVNDLVIFRPEKVENVKRAYFVKKFENYLDDENNKNNIKKYFKSVIKED
ncbi:MAG: hypothetical protein IKN63_00305 [Bacilli bacterium]|nr:hypothetical protein [Bacilli bacterium]